MSAITTHVLDTALGRPAAGVPVRLERVGAQEHADAHHAWGAEEAALLGQPLGEATTDEDGRARDLGPDRIAAGRYRLVFDTASYFQETDQSGFFPEVAIAFTVEDPAQHYHVPLLLSPYSYSTYRGS